MTERFPPEDENIPGNSGDIEPEATSRFRKKSDIDEAFAAIARQLGHEGSLDGPVNDVENAQKFINVIARNGINATARAIHETLQFKRGTYEPAESRDVIKYLASLRTRPPIKITDIGSIDSEIVEQLNLSKENYVDEIRDLVTFLNEDISEISVLDFPEIRRKMLEKEIEVITRSIVKKMIDEHGISVVFDVEDQKAWNDLKKTIEDLSDESMRDYSCFLRNNKMAGGWTPIRDVIDTMDDSFQIKETAFRLAKANAEATDHQRKRMLDGLAPHIRTLVRRYLEDLDALREEGQDLK